MRRVDRWLGLALGALAGAVIWTSLDFPAVPGQKVGAGFLPGLIGVGLLVCALALVARGVRSPAAPAEPARPTRRLAPAAVLAAVVLYVVAAERVGFLLLVPPLLFGLFLVFDVRPRAALLWALGGTLLVHLAFYKLLRVPLPWGLLRPFY
ncbi:MAG: tripartite tricarboxylate transporter TctB family protein [Rubrivivax sp.]